MTVDKTGGPADLVSESPGIDTLMLSKKLRLAECLDSCMNERKKFAARIEALERALYELLAVDTEPAAGLTESIIMDGKAFREFMDGCEVRVAAAHAKALLTLSGITPPADDKCPMCNGEGWEWTDPPTNKVGDCSTCKGSGRKAIAGITPPADGLVEALEECTQFIANDFDVELSFATREDTATFVAALTAHRGDKTQAIGAEVSP